MWGLHVRRSQLAQAQSSEPLAHVNTSVELLALDDASNEATSKGIAGAGGVDNLILVNRMYRVALGITLVLHGDNSRISSLCDDGHSLSLSVLLWQVGECLGNGWNVVSVQVVRVSICDRFGLISNNVIPVWSSLIERFLEELADERRRER